MSLTAPPPVQDPVPGEVDDAVIKEAKRRARRRRWSYSGVVVALAAVAAFAAWGPTPPVQSPPTAGGGGDGGAGALALEVPAGCRPGCGRPDGAADGVRRAATRGCRTEQPSHRGPGVLGDDPPVRVWGYADGRMISYRNGAAAMPEAANDAFSGFLEQHLTPEGVEMLRSYLVDNARLGHPHRRHGSGMVRRMPAHGPDGGRPVRLRRRSRMFLVWGLPPHSPPRKPGSPPPRGPTSSTGRTCRPNSEICYRLGATAPTGLYGPPPGPRPAPWSWSGPRCHRRRPRCCRR